MNHLLAAVMPGIETLVARFSAVLEKHRIQVRWQSVASQGQDGAPALRHELADVPVLQHLDDALIQASEDGDTQLQDALRRILPQAAWTRTASYALDKHLFAGYAYTSLYTDLDVSLGIVLLGPNVTYRAHHHPAEEYYLPLGSIRWDHGKGWVDEPAGALLHHAPWQPHAMATHGRPVLLAYLWLGDLNTPAVFVEP